MYKLTWILFALFALILPILAAPVPVPEEDSELEKRVTHSGRGTWYYPGLGNCGGTNNQDQLVVAMPKSMYDRNGGSNCWQWIQIHSGGKSVRAQMVDSCPGCGPSDLDMSPATFQALASLDVGVINIQWNFLKK
ncbi:RlpA-like double-psi beta-barrel-protein domain-containing protein-containing protein [Multifurca ochricompacta]|uniref:RlpA-like double-psi beta-barrel-protein domain-containing protein-containing protein n=1 Tax=Multifurca ochricompacta TaxID=376703 RepID=A0AAD4M6A5_9AGAM|nr:RlpA-like double-psi beta-barrel-protein domain-containing protein-containing protein [Multifurca ochricompacta]